MQSKRQSVKKKRRFALVLSFGLMMGAGKALAQSTPPPPPTPPAPGEVLDKINPFKKQSATKTHKDSKQATPSTPAGAPPPPPDPFHILRRKNPTPANAPVSKPPAHPPVTPPAPPQE